MAYWPHPMAKTPEIGVGHEFNNLGTGLHYILSMHAFSYISELYKIIRVEKNFCLRLNTFALHGHICHT